MVVTLSPMASASRPTWLRVVLFVASAAAAALALRLTWEAPLVGVAILIGLGSLWLARFVARRRLRQLLRSGDVERVLARWTPSLRKVPHPETMGPLMTATAFAAYGWVSQAREALDHAAKGPAWDAAIEHRLFVDALLLTFEGASDEALERARALGNLPLPPAEPFLVERVRTLRRAMAALARAFSHAPIAGDQELLIEASRTSPLVHWAMRYGAAIVSIDDGKIGEARALLSGAPSWPAQSCFHAFHAELSREVARRGDEGPSSIEI
jgi:hypothetical protein